MSLSKLFNYLYKTKASGVDIKDAIKNSYVKPKPMLGLNHLYSDEIYWVQIDTHWKQNC